ncbi:97 kDa heat shock protein, partial [Trichinella spiralis]|uniref:97 kDa heat shock protein n=1 Tax=Trichinella spiralis TaxID=6334 RepID=UPI0001EFE9F2
INFEQLDRGEREREDAKNSLEEYVYDMRDKLGGILQPYIIGHDASRLRKLLEETEMWLYEDGEEQPKRIYQQKLTEMKDLSDPVVERYNEAGLRPQAFEELGRNLQMAKKMYDAYVAKVDTHTPWLHTHRTFSLSSVNCVKALQKRVGVDVRLYSAPPQDR